MKKLNFFSFINSHLSIKKSKKESNSILKNSCNTIDNTPPSTPQNLYLTYNKKLNQITLNWDASTDNISVIGYCIYKNNHLIIKKLANPTQKKITWIDPTEIEKGKKYEYKVCAFDLAKNHSNYAIKNILAFH